MARPLRLQVADGVYHLTARGNERKAIYRDAADRERFLEILAATLERFAWRCLSYCLMTNHYHLLARTLEPNLARGMRDLNGVYAQAFQPPPRTGRASQGRYRAVLVERDEHLLATVAYIVRNPVRAGLCAEPGGWRWSSHRAAMGERPPGLLALDELLLHFAPRRTLARELYRGLTEDETRERMVSPCEGVIEGSDNFVRLHLTGVSGSSEIPRAHVRPPRRPLEQVLAPPVSIEEIALAYACGYTMPAIASHLGLHPSTVSRRLSLHRAQIKT